MLVSVLLTLNIFQTLFYSFCVSFEQVIAGWDNLYRSIHLSCSSKRCSQACNFIKKTPQHRCFPVSFMKFLRTPFIQNASRLMLLYLAIKQKTMQVVVQIGLTQKLISTTFSNTATESFTWKLILVG